MAQLMERLTIMFQGEQEVRLLQQFKQTAGPRGLTRLLKQLIEQHVRKPHV